MTPSALTPAARGQDEEVAPGRPVTAVIGAQARAIAPTCAARWRRRRRAVSRDRRAAPPPAGSSPSRRPPGAPARARPTASRRVRRRCRERDPHGRARAHASRRRGAAGGLRTAAYVRALPDHALLDRIIRGRAWIPLLGVLLAGIVAMQVEVLKLNAGIGRSIERGSALQAATSCCGPAWPSSPTTSASSGWRRRWAWSCPRPSSSSSSDRAPAASQRALSSIHAPNATDFLAPLPTIGAAGGPAGHVGQHRRRPDARPARRRPRHGHGVDARRRARRRARSTGTTVGERDGGHASAPPGRRPPGATGRRRDTSQTPRPRDARRAPDPRGGPDRSVGLVVQRRGGRDARRRLGDVAMVAIDRRVGYIFVAFLSLLAVAVVRAVYLGVVRADSLQQAAVSQQITNRADSRHPRGDHRSQRGAAGALGVGRRRDRRPVPDQAGPSDADGADDGAAAAHAGAQGAHGHHQAAHRLRRRRPGGRRRRRPRRSWR